MNRLGRSLAYPPRPDGRGGLATVEGVEAVSDSLRAIIDSSIGDHPFEPWLGWPAQVFMPIGDADAIAVLIKEAIINAEDRIEERTLQVIAGIGDEGVLLVEVLYRIQGDATARTLQAGFRQL